MSSDGSAALGAWEDRPKRNFEADVTGVQLDQREAFLLTRLDGMATVAEICSISGFDEDETLEVLRNLLAHGLIEIEQADGVRALIAERTSDGRRRVQRRQRRAEAPEERAPDFAGVSAEDEAWLRRHGHLGHVPGQPFAAPGQGRYGSYRFDDRELLRKCQLRLDERREIVFLSENLQHLDHFEFFEAEPTEDRRELKKAYFSFSKRYHPDNFFGKETGPFGERIEAIYRHGTEVYEALSNNGDLRAVYRRAIESRDLHYRSGLEAERAVQRQKTRRRKQEQAEGRKVDLRARLERNKKERRGRGTNPVAERLAKAERFYQEGMASYEAESFIAAANSLRLAMSYDEKNEHYARAYERVSEKAKTVRAELLWKRGYLDESIGHNREALQAYLQAVDIYPRPDYCAHTAELLLSHSDEEHRAVQLGEIAVRGEPHNVDYLLLLGKIYTQVGRVKKALSTYEKVLALEPKHEIAKKAVKALKRM